ncbi:9995_t:CDS:2 [Diversispora eburnea]|uniref:9995_t:CDS:1 n=1 Tax=Diversispora eburnea TaxID=1213867 RepID=A0A9N8YY99_9GLOM|nr:9995_t:CDS:2 [Diversispora eburnea]
MEEDSYNPEINPEILQGDDSSINSIEEIEVLNVITVDQEYAEKSQVFQENLNILQNLNILPSSGDPLEEYFRATQTLVSWMTSNFPTFPSYSTLPIDLDYINLSDQSLSKIETEIISKQLDYNQLNDLLLSNDNSSSLLNPNLLKEHSIAFEKLWQIFFNLIELGKLKCQELKWVAELNIKVDEVDVEIKKAEVMLEGVEESRKKTHDDVVAAEEIVHDVSEKVKEVNQLYQHERFRAPEDLKIHIQLIITSNVPNLKNKINITKQTLAYDRRIVRWFDGSNEADKIISDTLNRVKQLEVPDFINKYEWSEEQQNLESLVNERRKIIQGIDESVQELKSTRIDELEKKFDETITIIKDSSDSEEQTVIELMTKQFKNLNERIIKLTDFITLLLSQTTTERYSMVINNLISMQNSRNQMAQIRKTIIEHNDAGLVHGDVKDLESQITNFENELLTDNSALSKALRQKHSKLLMTIQNIRIALAENRLQMAAYLSPSSPSSPTSAGSEFERLQVKIRDKLEYFHSHLAFPPTYLNDTDAENEEPERVHGLTCNDDHVEEFIERYNLIESELISFERSQWVEFWLKSEPVKRIRGNEVAEEINEMESKFASIKDLMEDRKRDIQVIKEGRTFAKAVNEIRDKLDNVKGQMRRGDTTTDASIQELDAHMVDARNLIKSLASSYAHLLSVDAEDQSYKEAFENQKVQLVKVEAWIEEVRIWFKEAERIRIWIDERINTLENVPKVDVFQEGDAPATQEEVDEWQNDYEEMERKTEKFDEEDITRLRAHVKNIMGNEVAASDSMSPADTMTISITLKTLKLLDQLLGMLKRRDNQLAVLYTRVQWEREFKNAMDIWNRINGETRSFILDHGRWKPPISNGDDGWPLKSSQPSQRDVTIEANAIERSIIDFENNTIPPTTEIFDELVELSPIEVPEHLMVKQENLEERDMNKLKSYMDFAKEVLMQRQQVLEYTNSADKAHLDCTELRDQLIIEEENPRGGSVEKKYIARVEELEKRINNSLKSTTESIRYPEYFEHDPSENVVVREAVQMYHKKLEEVLEETNEALKNYQRSLKLKKMAEEYKKEAERLGNWISQKDKFVINRKFDVFRNPCNFSSKDIEDYAAGNAQIVVDVHNFDQDELKTLKEKVVALVDEVKSIKTKAVNTDELESMIVTLDEKLNGLRDNIQILQSREPDEVNSAQKRLTWEESHKNSSDFINDSLKRTKSFIAEKASWKLKTPEDINAREVLDNEFTTIEENINNFVSNVIVSNKSNYDAFIEASDKLTTDKEPRKKLEGRQSELENNVTKLKDHVSYSRDLLNQRAEMVEYNAEATTLDNFASELKDNLIQAEKNVSSGPSEIDFDSKIKEFNQKVTTLWDEKGSKISYPTSTIMDEVKVTKNESIKEAAQKRLSTLRHAEDELNKLYDTYKSSLALQERANECIKNSERLQSTIEDRLKTLNDLKVDPLSQIYPYDTPQVQEMLDNHELFKQENTRIDLEDISEVRRNVESLIEDIKKANCKSVDPKPIRESLNNLNKIFGDIQNLSSLHQLDLNVLQTRSKWEELYDPNLSSIKDLTSEINDFIENKARWNQENSQPMTDLQDEFINLKQKVTKFEENSLFSFKTAYNEMATSMKSFLSKSPPPQHIVDRQLGLNKKFDELVERVNLSDQVLKQREAINSFFSQSDTVEKEGDALKALINSAEENGEVDPSFPEKVATFNKNLDDLRKNLADKIPYPKDKLSGEDIDASIKQARYLITSYKINKFAVNDRLQELDQLSKGLDDSLKSYQETMSLSEELDNVLSDSKKLEDELDRFTSEKALWKSQESPVAESEIDSVIKKLNDELEDIKKKISDFENKKVEPINNKIDEYQTSKSEFEKDIPEHVKNRQQAVNDSMQKLKSIEDYAKEILLSNEPSSPGGEGNSVSIAVNSFSERVKDLWDDVASKIIYPTCSVQNDQDRTAHSEDCNSVIREAVKAQNESLASLSNSLNDLLHTHKNVLRRKLLIESYLKQANDVASWIQPGLNTLEGILNNENLCDLSEDQLHQLISEIDAIEAARQSYHSTFDFAKNLANKLIEDMTNETKGDNVDDDVKADLELVLSKSQEIDTLWENLQANVPKAKQIIDQALQVKDFKEKAKEVLSKINELSNIMIKTPVEDVSDADMKDWEIKLNSLEQTELFSLIKVYDLVRENLQVNIGALSEKEAIEMEEVFQQIVNAIDNMKNIFKEKNDEVEAYQSEQIAKAFICNVNDLQQWIDDTISTFQNAKQNNSIMVANSSDLNNKNFHDLTGVIKNFNNQLPDRMSQLERIRSDFIDINSRESGHDLQEITEYHSNLDDAWEKLDTSAEDINKLLEKVSTWHDRHEDIYRIENEIFNVLESRINSLSSIDFNKLEAEVKELDENIKKASIMLEEVKTAALQIHDIPNNVIDEFNRQNFDIHYDQAVERLAHLSESFQTALAAAHNASQLAAFHADANRVIASCYEGIAIVKSRNEELERSSYYALEIDSLSNLLYDALDGNTQSKEKLEKCEQQVKNNLKDEADKLIEQNPETNKERVLNIFNKVTVALDQFNDAVVLEHRELDLVRKVHTHTKAAHDIKNWMSACKKAALEIQVGTVEQEEGICELEDKVAKFQATVDAFKGMSHQVLLPEINNVDIDEPRPEESNPIIKESIQTRTNRVLEDWYALKDLVNHLRISLNASKESQEVSRAINDILVAVGQVKERVLNIESFVNGDGVPRLPTIDDVENGERELEEIQAEVDHILGHKIDALDDLINNLTERDVGYVQQRAGIAETLTNLASIIDNKRSQLKEAHNLAIFGTKADEMNALMRSLLDVIDVASKTEDGSPLELLIPIELQSRSIEVETKYNYYQPKIDQKLLEAQHLAEQMKDDWRVVDRLGILNEQWNELNEVALSKKEQLKRILSGQKSSPRTPTTRHARSNSQIYSGSRPFSPTKYSRSSTRPPSRNAITPKTSSSSLRYRTGTPKTPTRFTPSPTPGVPGSPRRPPIRLLPHSVNNYIPDPNDDLDVEVARIVNACPVKISVSMVEGESGKYMFGEVDPKLCYCKILRSRMVMVRVGGGWAELSKFLVEHANLEQKYIPKARSFVGIDGNDENEPTTSKSSPGPNVRKENISKGPDVRFDDPTKSGSPLALKRMTYTRKVSSLDNNDRSRFGKPKSLSLQKLNPRKISWTIVYRRMHKKGITEEVAKKRTRRTVKTQRAIVGASLEVIKDKRNQKPEVREAARAADIREAKEKKKQEQAKRKAEKAKTAQATNRGQQKISKQQARGAQSKISGKSR